MSIVVAVAAVLPAATSANRSSPVQLTFTKKQASANVYIGTIDGGGTIEMLILDRRSTAERQYFSAFFRVDVGSQWFAARVRGTFEFATLQTSLRGRVTDGNWLQGARVLEEGNLVDMDPLTFAGTLTLARPCATCVAPGKSRRDRPARAGGRAACRRRACSR